jgi:hypothetical protein
MKKVVSFFGLEVDAKRSIADIGAVKSTGSSFTKILSTTFINSYRVPTLFVAIIFFLMICVSKTCKKSEKTMKTQGL